MKKMSFSEFKHATAKIMKSQFQSAEDHPLLLGINRAQFEEWKLKRAIGIARRAPYNTARRRREGWERKLLQVQANRARMEKLRSELLERPHEKGHEYVSTPRRL